ncbi:MAG: amphi-Trp domain-containing protein [Halobacteriaceae archaeon]
MPEATLFETEERHDRAEIAAYLRTVADRLDAGERLTLAAGDEQVTLAVPAEATFEVKAEREGPADGPGELSVEFEIEWEEGAGEGGLAIE